MRTFLSLLVILLLLRIAKLVSAHSAAKELRYTPREILRKTRDAKSAQDFEELASYYEKQAKEFWTAGAQQRHEREFYQTRNGGNQCSLASERARRLREYYDTRAKECEMLAKKYGDRALALAPGADDPLPGQNSTSTPDNALRL